MARLQAPAGPSPHQALPCLTAHLHQDLVVLQRIKVVLQSKRAHQCCIFCWQSGARMCNRAKAGDMLVGHILQLLLCSLNSPPLPFSRWRRHRCGAG